LGWTLARATGHDVANDGEEKTMNIVTGKYSWVSLLLFCITTAWYAGSLDPDFIERQQHYGALSLVPALATLVICFVTRNVIFALFMGVVLGGLVTGQHNIVQHFLIPSIGTTRFAEILLVYLWALGGLLGIWNRNGGAYHFAQHVSQSYVKSRRSALFFAWLMGMIFHQGGTISTVLTGTTVRPVADREKVAHEELAYVVDSTASPVATIIPFNVWPVYVAGLIAIPSMSHFIADSGGTVVSVRISHTIKISHQCINHFAVQVVMPLIGFDNFCTTMCYGTTKNDQVE
jgi:hypothetical protein